jgi:hypothetical protein
MLDAVPVRGLIQVPVDIETATEHRTQHLRPLDVDLTVVLKLEPDLHASAPIARTTAASGPVP